MSSSVNSRTVTRRSSANAPFDCLADGRNASRRSSSSRVQTDTAKSPASHRGPNSPARLGPQSIARRRSRGTNVPRPPLIALLILGMSFLLCGLTRAVRRRRIPRALDLPFLDFVRLVRCGVELDEAVDGFGDARRSLRWNRLLSGFPRDLEAEVSESLVWRTRWLTGLGRMRVEGMGDGRRGTQLAVRTPPAALNMH